MYLATRPCPFWSSCSLFCSVKTKGIGIRFFDFGNYIARRNCNFRMYCTNRHPKSNRMQFYLFSVILWLNVSGIEFIEPRWHCSHVSCGDQKHILKISKIDFRRKFFFGLTCMPDMDIPIRYLTDWNLKNFAKVSFTLFSLSTDLRSNWIWKSIELYRLYTQLWNHYAKTK